MKQKKDPIRTCLGCGEAFSKKTLIRIVRSPDGTILLDATGKKPGRGAYICKNKACLAKLMKNKRLSKEFECAIGDEIFEQLGKELDRLGQG